MSSRTTHPKTRIAIVGGGTAGITVAAMLRRHGFERITLIEPSETHYYQPFWTLVGAGVVPKEASARPTAKLIPKGVEWIGDRAKRFDPEAGRVETERSGQLDYDYLVVAPGLQLDWDAIRGLPEALETPAVSSNYDYRLCEKTWRGLRAFRGGTALFHCPPMPIKCAGSPQKIAYLAAHHFERDGIRDKCDVVFATATPSIFGVKEYADILEGIVERYGIDARYQHNLVEVDGAKREAVFEVRDGEAVRRTDRIAYDLLHVVPPQSAPDFIKASPLSDGSAKGWVDVDPHTLQHTRYPNVFGLGDATNTPNAKTGAAIRQQAPVLVQNLMAVVEGDELPQSYGGYGSCPLVTGYGRLLLAEFDYSGKPCPSLRPLDTMKERYDMWLLKRYGIPFLYWNGMMRGRVAAPWSRS